MNQPKPLGLSQIFMRFFTGLGAGFTGSIVLGIVLFLTWGIVGNTLSATPTMPDDLGLSIAPNSTHPLFLFFVILGVFLSILIANLANVLLIGIVDEKYQHRSTLLSHTFFGNLALLLLIIPVYFAVAKTWGPESAGFAALFHVIISSLFSFFVLEVLNEKKYLIVNVYGAIIGFYLHSPDSSFRSTRRCSHFWRCRCCLDFLLRETESRNQFTRGFTRRTAATCSIPILVLEKTTEKKNKKNTRPVGKCFLI
mgnify:CR=1 FL=1